MFENQPGKGSNSFPEIKQQAYHNLFNEKPSGIAQLIKFGGFLFLFMAAILAVLFFLRTNKNKPTNIKQSATSSQSAVIPGGILPGGNGEGGDGDKGEALNKILTTEGVTFGYFYKKQKEDFKSNAIAYQLPINIKSDTVNYYDLSRKINIDDIVDEMNQYGFAVKENVIGKENNNFWDLNRYLIGADVPLVVTSDFLLYYFQNLFKSAYKDIQKSVFYENLYEINLDMYNTALARYKIRSSSVAMENDPVLEAEFLETAFFAVGLKLLEPSLGQINEVNFADENKFNKQEAEYYSFLLPEYLKNGVIEKEVELIKKGSGVMKSPVLLYEKDYSKFAIPEIYKKNAKLYNFLLALEWMKSEFPLYYQTENCSDCLLDKDDWRINMTAAGLIASDLYNNADTKNKWATIYKFIAFFSGLRQDLSYLQYHQAYEKTFGQGYDIISIYDKNNSEWEKDIASVIKSIEGNNFSRLEGFYDRNAENKKRIGMRLLQESFWPNDYIFEALSGEEFVKTGEVAKNKHITACLIRKGESAFRCNGFGLDIVNLIKPVELNFEKFVSNTDYTNYENISGLIADELKSFDFNTWNNNVYWINFDMNKYILAQHENYPVYMNNDQWTIDKNYNTALGSWVNVNLPEDELEIYSEDEKGTGLGYGFMCNSGNYIEPNLDLINEMISRNEMLSEMISTLKVSKQTSAVLNNLKNYNISLLEIKKIIKKELSNEGLSEDDCRFIKFFAKNYNIKRAGGNKFLLQGVTESNEGVKLVFIVYRNHEDKKIIAVGPIFNYQELLGIKR